jgi:adenylate kinase
VPYVALTGTPGTGKSTVGGLLADQFNVIEVGTLARRIGSGRRGSGRGTVVDVEATARWIRRHPVADRQLLVGHLAHLLPVDGAIVLRCRPTVLRRRLLAAHRGSARERAENTVAEATDVILIEARDRRLDVWQVDTTGRSRRSIVREVKRILTGEVAPGGDEVRWLEDPRETAHLLDSPR